MCLSWLSEQMQKYQTFITHPSRSSAAFFGKQDSVILSFMTLQSISYPF